LGRKERGNLAAAPLYLHPHDVDVKALTRLAVVYDIPMASSRATADLIVLSGFFVI
jgi:methylglyoxal synthase